MSKLLTATAIAIGVAAVILMTIVLPAEYGIDPLGTGRALHLTDLAKATPAPAAQKAPAASAQTGSDAKDQAVINPVLVPSPTDDAPRVKNTFIAQPDRFQFDSREMTLARGEGMEIKYNMKKGAGLVYSWTASEPVAYEFHGEPNVKPEGKGGTDYYESYELDDAIGKNQSHGTFVAPSTGIHGWFWQNMGDHPVKVKLITAGFYNWIMQSRNDHQTALKPMDADALPSHPTVPDQPSK